MKKIIKLALVLLVLASCAPQTRLVKIQRTKTIEGNHYVVGPAVYIELTNKQLNELISEEERQHARKPLEVYPIRQMYLKPKK